MKGQHALRIYALALGILLLSVSFAKVANANDVQQRQFLVGSGFFCAFSGTACPDVASAPSNGDKVSVTGSGTFYNQDSGGASGGGTFLHTTSEGAFVASGTWGVVSLISFTSFGLAPPPPDLPPGTEGGLAVFLVHLTPSTGGAGFDATLTVTCKVGSPPSGLVEGIKLAVSDGPDFSTTLTGLTAFITQD